jgi:hypothetical protein
MSKTVDKDNLGDNTTDSMHETVSIYLWWLNRIVETWSVFNFLATNETNDNLILMCTTTLLPRDSLTTEDLLLLTGHLPI